jgi:hypothetical protein
MKSLFQSANLQDKKARYTNQSTFLRYLSVLAKLCSQDTYRSSEIMIWGIDPTRRDRVVNASNDNIATEQLHFLSNTDFFSAGTAMFKYMYDKGNSLDEVIDFLNALVVFMRAKIDVSEEDIKQTYIYWRLVLLAYDSSKRASLENEKGFYTEGLYEMLKMRDTSIGSTMLLEAAKRLHEDFSENGKEYMNQFDSNFDEIEVVDKNPGLLLSERLTNALKPVCDVFIHPAEIEAQLMSIPPMMAELMSTMDEDNPDHVIEVAARLHNAIIAVHPYKDKNGTIAQRVANDFCKLYGIAEPIFKKSIEYDQAVNNDFASAPQRVDGTTVGSSHLADHGKLSYRLIYSLSTGILMY